MMKKHELEGKIVYGVWQEPEDDDLVGYFSQYDSINDAVAAEGENCEVFEMKAHYLGKFKLKSVLVKSK